jgi:hypothetical protein
MDIGVLFPLYYSTLIVCVLAYVGFAWRFRLKLASASNVAFVYAFIIIALPGFYVAEGTVHDVVDQKFNAGFDTQLYWIYLLFMPIVSSALLLGQAAGQRLFVETTFRMNSEVKIKLLVIVSIGYCLAYLLWLPYIPLNNLAFSGSSNLGEVILQRIAITHGLGQEGELPFVFRYWRNIVQGVLPVLFYYYLITRQTRRRAFLPIFIFFVSTLYLQLFTLEKAPFFVFMLGILFLFYLRRQNTSVFAATRQVRSILRYGIGLASVFVCLSFVYQYFMGIEYGLMRSMLSRFAGQSASNYVQIDFIRHVGFLGFSGIKMPILSSLLNIEFIDPSKYAISVIYPSRVVGEVMGAAGGMSLTNLYYIIGWYSVPAFFLFVTAFGYFDRVLVNSIYNPVNRNAFYFNISFYTMGTFHFATAVGSYIWIAFAIPTVLSPPLIIVAFFYFLFIKIPGRILRKRRLGAGCLTAGVPLESM